MTNQTISTTKLKNRRNELKKQRQWRSFITFVRIVLTMSLFGGVFWFFTLPNWVLRDSQQIDIEGNNCIIKLLSDPDYGINNKSSIVTKIFMRLKKY